MTQSPVGRIPDYVYRDLLNEGGLHWVMKSFQIGEEFALEIIGMYVAVAIQRGDERTAWSTMREGGTTDWSLSYEPGRGLAATLTPNMNDLYPTRFYTPRYGQTVSYQPVLLDAPPAKEESKTASVAETKPASKKKFKHKAPPVPPVRHAHRTEPGQQVELSGKPKRPAIRNRPRWESLDDNPF